MEDRSPRGPVKAWQALLAILAVLVGLALLVYSIVSIVRESGPTATPSPSPTPPPRPELTISPDVGYAGSYITLRGRNFKPDDLVMIFLSPPLTREEDYAYDSTTAAQDGTFIASIVFPDDPALLSRGIVAIVARSQSKQEAAAPFRILPPTPIPPTPTPMPTPTATPTPPLPTATVPPPPTPTPTEMARPILYWKGDYYDNAYLLGEPVMTRDDQSIDFDWGTGSPDPAVPPDNFSVRWSRELQLAAGTYQFRVRTDDGSRLFVDGDLLIDQWHDSLGLTYTADKYLAQGEHLIVMEYYEHLGTASALLTWDYEDVFPDWKGEYFSNITLSGEPMLVRNDDQVDFDWGFGSPAADLPPDNFSARWTREWYFLAEKYRFYARARDGVRVWLDDILVIDEWHLGTDTTYAGDINVGSEGFHEVRIEYYNQSGSASIKVSWERPIAYTNWKGEYFSNMDLRGQPVFVRDDPSIDFDWGLGSPGPGMPSDSFSVRWTRDVTLSAGSYTFSATLDDGMRVWVDGWEIINSWHDGIRRTITADFEGLSSGPHSIIVEYYEHLGEAVAQFSWARQATQSGGPQR